MPNNRLLPVLLASLAVAATPLSPARAADYANEPPPAVAEQEPLVPPCTDAGVLADVEDQFEYGAVHMLKTGYTIVEFRDVFEKAYFPYNDDRPIERRYCQGEVTISDGRTRTLYYVVSHPLGFASIGWKAEGCVLGLDRWLVYGANCQSLRRF